MSGLRQYLSPRTWQNFDAILEIVKTQEMVENWEGLSSKTFVCVVQNAVNFANLGGLDYPRPVGMQRGDLLEISVGSSYSSDLSYECSVTFRGRERRNVRLSNRGAYPTARLSFRRSPILLS